MNIYCTLFDSNYLDKGLVLYHSLCACEPDFRLYVFAFDERCREVLEAEALEHMVVVPLSEFETPELQRSRRNAPVRSIAGPVPRGRSAMYWIITMSRCVLILMRI